jgi:hypothetical protein
MCAAMYWVLQFSYLLSLALAIPAGALLLRVFIVQPVRAKVGDAGVVGRGSAQADRI